MLQLDWLLMSFSLVWLDCCCFQNGVVTAWEFQCGGDDGACVVVWTGELHRSKLHSTACPKRRHVPEHQQEIMRSCVNKAGKTFISGQLNLAW